MIELQGKQLEFARPLFQDLDYHLSIFAVIEGTVQGKIWVDSKSHPRTAFALTPEAQYLAGDPLNPAFNRAIGDWYARRAHVELIYDSPCWEAQFDDLLAGKFARKFPRLHYLLKTPKMPNWKELIPADFVMFQVDREFLKRTYLKNFGEVSSRTEDWGYVDNFVEKGFGFCLLHDDDTIVSRCIADNVSGAACEVGIGTDADYRRQGFAALTLAATVESCLSKGFTRIGWHCLENNTGSWKTAEKAGFELSNRYPHYHNGFPAENPCDLSLEEWLANAEFYSRAFELSKKAIGQQCFIAAACWAIGGESEKAIDYLQALSHIWWKGNEGHLPKWVLDHWAFQNLDLERNPQALLSSSLG
jgi:RimJ/RimL family protein N-acetyltransferase